MTSYSATVLDHFEHPRNVGNTPHPDAVGSGANPICGDRVRLELRIDGNTIQSVRWRGEGCVPTLAAASLVSEMLQGMSLVDADRIDEGALTLALGGLPARKSHAASLIVHAIGAALGSRVGPECSDELPARKP